MGIIYGSKAGEQPDKPTIADDTVASITKVKMLYLLGEGEIRGLVKGAASIYLDGTPLEDEDGTRNFDNVEWDIRYGTVDQTYIPGMPYASTENRVNTELRYGTPWTRYIDNAQLSSVNVNVSWARLVETQDDGDVTGTTVNYAIDVRTDGGSWVTKLDASLTAKTSGKYQRTHNITLPQADSGWQIRVRKLTEDGDNELVFNKMQVDSIAEVIDVKLRYPHSAVLYISFDSRTFSNTPKVTFELFGRYLKVPTNYDADTRKSTGIWNGTFKEAYSNNPAWVYYDSITNDRYGLGDRLQPFMINKWAIEYIAQLCDVMVSDGNGGLEPRYTCNLYLNTAEEAFKVLQHLAGIFRGMAFWDGSQIRLDADTNKDTDYVITRANVIDGAFEKSGTAREERHTVAKVAYADPDNSYEKEYVMVRNERAIQQYGINILELNAIGCTSEGQAHRMGLAALLTEQNRTQTVSFAMGLDGSLPTVGSRIDIADIMFTGENTGGRISGVSADRRTITVDRDNVPVANGDKLVVNLESGKAQTKTISSISGREITVSSAFDDVAAQNAWAVSTDDVPMMPFIVLSVTPDEDGGQYNYTALQYDTTLQEQIDNGTIIDNSDKLPPLDTNKIEAPAFVELSARHRIEQAQTITTLVISWEQVKHAVSYDVEWRKGAGGTWVKLPRTDEIQVELEGIYSGNYQARVRAINAFGVMSRATTSELVQINGKDGLPPALKSLTATGVLFGMHLQWQFADGSGDADYTEIEVASAPDTNVALLGHYSYPTDNHKINGLLDGLVQYYRGRVVDKLGFKSEWTEWVEGVVKSDVNQVLDLISGHIEKSHLAQELATPIDKIELIGADIQQEIQDRIAQYDDLGADLLAEAQARIDAISNLEGGLTAEAQARINAVQANADAILAETQARESDISAVNSDLSDEVQARIDAVQATNQQIQLQAQNRINAISDVQQRINDEVDARIAAINDAKALTQAERNARIAAVQSAAQEQQDALQQTADNLANDINAITIAQSQTDSQVATIKELQQTIINENGAQATQLNYLSSEIDHNYADKNEFADSGKGTVWTFAKSVARDDWINAENIRGVTAELNNSNAKFTEQISTTVTQTEAVAQQITDLSAQMVGGYDGSDLDQVTSGLLHQERQARATDFEGLAEQISLLSAGVGEQFDPFKIWHFNNDSEGWSGGTYNSGYINARTAQLNSPTLTDLDGNAYHHIKFRVEKVGSPTWSGLVEWSGGSTTIDTPVFVDNVATVNANVYWSQSVSDFSIKVAETADNNNYYKVDWIAVGRPSPGASYASLLNEQRTRASADQALTQSINALDSKLNTKTAQLSSSINEQLQTITDEQSTQSEQLTTLDSKVDTVNNTLSSQITNVNNTLSNEQQTQATTLNQLSAEIDHNYADKTQYVDVNRSTQWTFAKSVAHADWTQNQRITQLQSEFDKSNATIYKSLETLADADSAQAIEISKLRADIVDGDNALSSQITQVNETLTNKHETQANQINQLTSDLDTTEQRLSSQIATVNNTLTTKHDTQAQQLNQLDSKIDNGNTALSSQIATVNNTLVNEQAAQAEQINTLDSKIDGVDSAVNARITETSQTLVEADEAQASQIEQLDSKIDGVDGSVNARITEINDTLVSADEAQATQINKISAEITSEYADKTQYADANRSILYTFANAIANEQYTQNTLITALQSDFDNNSASIEQSLKTLVDADSAQAEQLNVLKSDVDTVNNSLSARITQTNETFADQNQTQTEQINFLDSKIDGVGADLSSTITDVNQTLSTDIQTQADRVTELKSSMDDADSELASNITATNSTLANETETRAEQFNQLDSKINTTQSELSSSINQVNETLTTKHDTQATQINNLSSEIAGVDNRLSSEINTVEQTLTTEQSSQANQINQLDSKIDGVDSDLNARITQTNETLTDVDNAQAVQLNQLSAEIDLGFADKNDYADVNRSIQWTFATSLANDDYTLNERILSMQSEFDTNTASITQSLNTLASKDKTQATQINQLQAEINNVDESLSSQITQTNETLTTESETRANQIEQLDSKYQTITGDIESSTNARITTVNDTLTDKHNAQANQISNLDTSLNNKIDGVETNLSSQINTVEQTLTNEQSSQATRIDNLDSKYQNITDDIDTATNARITDVNNTLTAEQDAQAERITQVNTALNNKVDDVDTRLSSDISSLESSLTTESETRANQYNQLNSDLNTKIDGVDTRLTSQITQTNETISDLESSQASQMNEIQATAETKGEIIFSATTPPVSKRKAQNLWIDTSGDKNRPKRWNGSAWVEVSDSVATSALERADNATTKVEEVRELTVQNQTAIQTEQTTRSDQFSAVASDVQTLQSTVGSNTSSIRNHQTTINGLSAQKIVTLDVNGFVTGYGTYNDGKTGTFAIRADSFWVGQPGGLSKFRPFVFYTTPRTIDGVTVPAGAYIDKAFIRRASVDTLLIKGNAVTIPVLSSTNGKLWISGGRETIQSLTIPSGMGKTSIDISFYLFKLSSNAVRGTLNVYVRIGGNLVFDGDVFSGSVNSQFINIPLLTSHGGTVQVSAYFNRDDGGSERIYVSRRSIRAITMRR